ncbi:hypothetical protein DV736_g6224, partial [Chaetothyriales sp. CBS 134916]
MAPSNLNAPYPGIPYFTPAHDKTPGAPFASTTTTTTEKTQIPTLFTPLTIRGRTLRNRIIVAPMCQYSTDPFGAGTGALTDYHIATLGHYALKGAALVFIEATGVQPNGRISPNCPGLWSDAQIDGVKRVADFVKSQGALAGIQLAHAGRKASCVAPWVAARNKLPSMRATKEVGGWPDDVVGPTEGDTWDGKGVDDPTGGYYPPRQLTEEELKQMVEDWKSAAVRAVKAGVDVIEIHAAHGYLLHQFLSPITNRRTDGYGGDFDRRTRLLKEIVQGVRSVVPDWLPLFLRLSGTEWLEETDLAKELGSWDVPSSTKLAKLLPTWGIDLLDVSSAGNHHLQRINPFDSKDYQTKIANGIRQVVKKEGLELLIGAVGLITEAQQARDIVEEGGNGRTIAEEAQVAKDMTQRGGEKEPMADVVLVARQFMREPEWVLRVATALNVDVAWPSQFLRVRFPRL